jgi:flagellar M-ring protein FliF
MKELLDRLMTGLKGTSNSARVAAGVVTLALLAFAGLAAVVAGRAHFELAFSGLTDHELAQVCKALSEAGIPFEQSQPPAPFVVYVDEGQRSSAYMAAYGAGALDKPLEGILSGQGVASVFESAEERAQGVRKREWQEMEKMLEELDFVAGARVRTSAAQAGGLLAGPAPAPTASVTLRVVGEGELSSAQSETVANLVSRGLGVDKTRLVVSDQSGRALYDGEARTEGREVRDLLDHQADYEQRTARAANAVLEEILGPNKARVTVSSEWDYAQSTTRKDTTAKGAVVQETKTSSEKPLSSSVGTAAGLSANTLDPDAPEAAPVGTPNSPVAAVEKTSEETKEYAPTVTREERVRLVPELKRLSVALFLDQSVEAQSKSLEQAIQAAVGFDAERRDGFTTIVLPFVVPPEAAPDESAAPVPVRPDPLLETLLERGVEIASALVFLVLLVRTLRGPKKARAAAAGTGTAPGAAATAAEVDAELLARAQVDELLKTDPAKVGELLARWAREEPVASH